MKGAPKWPVEAGEPASRAFIPHIIASYSAILDTNADTNYTVYDEWAHMLWVSKQGCLRCCDLKRGCAEVRSLDLLPRNIPEGGQKCSVYNLGISL
jgi:hypothetical protein